MILDLDTLVSLKIDFLATFNRKKNIIEIRSMRDMISERLQESATRVQNYENIVVGLAMNIGCVNDKGVVRRIK